jgi:hypothetical protein
MVGANVVRAATNIADKANRIWISRYDKKEILTTLDDSSVTFKSLLQILFSPTPKGRIFDNVFHNNVEYG